MGSRGSFRRAGENQKKGYTASDRGTNNMREKGTRGKKNKGRKSQESRRKRRIAFAVLRSTSWEGKEKKGANRGMKR